MPSGEVGTRADGLLPAAGSVGLFADGAGWRFSALFGSAALPAGFDEAPASPELVPDDAPELVPAGAVGFCAAGFEPAAGSAGLVADGAG